MTAGRELAFPRPPVNYEAYEATRAYMYITGDMCNADRRERVRRWNLSGSILDARLQTISLSFNSLSSPGWVATARWTSGAGAMGSKPECFQFLESEEMKNRLEQHMKDALTPYSGGKFWLGRPPRRP